MAMPKVKSRVTGTHHIRGVGDRDDVFDMLQRAWDMEERMGIRDNPMKRLDSSVPELTPEPQRDGEDLPL